MDIVLATRNKNKVEEIKKIFALQGETAENVSGINIFTLDDFPGCEDVIEDGETFEANAVKKAVYISECAGMTAIADDSGLEVDALHGAPGVLSARFAGKSSDDKANLEKLLNKMKDISHEKRNARFVCCISMASKRGVKTFFGYIRGKIATEPRGENGFGYDPVFYPEGHNRTFAEMNDEEKNAISHRGNALRALQRHLLEKKGEGY